jgi:KDO2-lipid IV(A) lauroyltransferase
MPEPIAYATFDRIADQQWRSHGSSVRRLEANLARVVGPIDPGALRELSRAGMRSYMRYWCDAFRLPGWDSSRIDTFEMRHPERLADPVASGRGVIAALPHMGNWDHAGAWCSQHISPVNTVAEKLEPEALYTAFVDFRTSLGMRIHGLGDPGVYQLLQDALVGGGLVALLADRDLSAKGVDVQFFGETARFPAGPAALAVDTGASLVPVSLFWEGHNVAEILPEIEPPTAGDRDERIRVTTQAVADALAAGIAEHPADWHMLQRVWLADLDPARLAARDASGRDS